jgi:alpha-L-rhamnosidase
MLLPLLFCTAASLALALPLPLPEKPYTGKGLRATALRCEYRVDPLGIDEPEPRLSWIVESGERAQRQSACRVLVASTESLLAHDRPDLWDTGKLGTDETTCLIYKGKELASHQACFWKVKVWDKNGKESTWSAPARWTMGLLKPADWKADWIGYDEPRQAAAAEAPLADAKWIWHAADEPGQAPKARRLFVTNFSLPPHARVKRAELIASADDALTCFVNSHRVLTTKPENDGWKQARQTDVTAQIKPGPNDIRVLVENATAGPAGLIARLTVATEDGQTFTLVSDAAWKSRAEVPTDWAKAKLECDTWPAAKVVGSYGADPWGTISVKGVFLPPPVHVRTSFVVDKPVARATLFATALGLADMHLNGKRVSDDYFTPGWTDYAKRVYYRTYDVTSAVKKGANALGAVLADGWFSGYVGYGGNRELYGKLPRVRVQLRLEFADGSVRDVTTGPTWKAAVGPTLEADFLQGETYDARKELPGWDKPRFSDAAWSAVNTGSEEVHPIVQAHPGPPVRPVHEFRARRITEPKPGAFVLDLGQNFAGVARLKVAGKPGQKITLRFAERLNPDGTVYVTNLRGARATDTYICKGGGVEIWQPRFTFHGFQYIEVTGLRGKPSADTVIGVALSSDTPVAGGFACSDPMLNQLHNNIFWTQRANFIDIPTDCPQRDERLGWTGDAQVYVRTATLNTDVQAFFTKWLVDLDEDGQRPDGQFPCVAPVKVAGADGGPAWADAGVICPWTIYSVYGDRRVLEQHYEAMKRFIEFCRNRSTPELLPPASYHCYGDWLSIKAETPKDIIYTAYFAHSTKLTARAAEALGKTDDATKYERLFERIRAAFNRAYVGPDGRIKGNTQTCYVLALAFDLLEGADAKAAAKYLVEDIEARGWHLSTGFIGTKDLMLALSKIGRSDVACRLLHNDTFPSWGFSIKHGATSIWERWDGWTPEKGFQDAGMNSFAHYSFGAVYQWMVENLGGIQSAAPAYKEIVVAPLMDAKLDQARVSYRSVRGLIETEWKRKNGTIELNVIVPANTTATLQLPATSQAAVTESGRALSKTDGIRVLRQEAGSLVLVAGSGTYAFKLEQATQPAAGNRPGGD